MRDYKLKSFEVVREDIVAPDETPTFCVRLLFEGSSGTDPAVKYVAYRLAQGATAHATALSLTELGKSIERYFVNGRNND